MLNEIQDRTPELSRAEQRVARWVVQHPKQASRATLAEVAMECGTSEPTVIRFCRSIGLDGFREFTIRLTEDLSSGKGFVGRLISDPVFASKVDSLGDAVDDRVRRSALGNSLFRNDGGVFAQVAGTAPMPVIARRARLRPP